VGLGQLSQSVSDKKVNLREVLKRVVAESPTLKNRFKDATLLGDIRGYGLPLGSRKVTMSGERFMLCGDAASLIDPLTGEGIGQAMVSGRYAGWQAAKCIAENKFSAACMKEYDDLVYAKFWKTHFSHYLAQKVIGDRPWVVNASIGLALRSSVLEKVLKKLFW
jgi:flavin-dependent dehydrogenase